MVMDLLDFAQTRFGDRIPIERKAVDIGRVLGDVVAEISVASPDRVIDVQTSGDLCGQWDGDRLAQVLTNLVGNAIDHGAADAPIVVGARGGEREVVISVQSAGTPIPENQLRQVFDAMSPTKPEGARDRRHLGLGLYIVNKIVAAHGGSVGVESSESSGTTFTVHLPREIG
jgi:signal transduction histidine kinase